MDQVNIIGNDLAKHSFQLDTSKNLSHHHEIIWNAIRKA